MCDMWLAETLYKKRSKVHYKVKKGIGNQECQRRRPKGLEIAAPLNFIKINVA